MKICFFLVFINLIKNERLCMVLYLLPIELIQGSTEERFQLPQTLGQNFLEKDNHLL